jgi:F0F1-type ATP synthase assembly protein I
VARILSHTISLFLILVNSACAGRLKSIGLPTTSTQPGTPIDSGPVGNWENLQQLKPGTWVAVYLENGSRMVQRFRTVTDSQLVLDSDGIDRGRVVAVALPADDRLRDGVFVGSCLGAGMGIGWGSVFSEDSADFSAAAATAGLLYGLAVGAGVGTLLDSGMATPEKPLYMRGGVGKALMPARNWTLKVPRHQLSQWVAGRKLELMLRDGTYLKGRAIEGTDSEIELAVTDASEKFYRGRKTRILTELISTVAYRENIGGNRLAASIGGGLGGVFSGALLGMSMDQDSDAKPLVIGASVGTLVGSTLGLGLAEHYNWRHVMLVVQ